MQQRLNTILASEVDPAFSGRARIILTEIEKNRPKVLLDAGCGRGFYLAAAAHYPFIKQIHGIDINSEYIKKAKVAASDKRVMIQKASIYRLPYSDNSIDFIIASEILEHLSDEKKALSELQRVLKKNGTLMITVPNYNFPFLWDPLNWLLMKLFNTHVNKDIWWLAGMWADHLRLYKPNELKQLIKQSGFTVVKQQNIIHNCWLFSHFLLYGIGKNLIERVGVNVGNRFDLGKKPSPVSLILAEIMKFPSRFDNFKSLQKSSIDIIIKAAK